MIGGGGGGSPEMAQAGGSKPEGLEEALETVYDIIHTNSSPGTHSHIGGGNP